jgi:ribosomal protein S18 acetylase RimI-like enzyme
MVGRVGYWSGDPTGPPSVVEFLLVSWDTDGTEIASRLLMETLAIFRREGARSMMYILDVPSWLHDAPERRIDLLRRQGFTRRRQTSRFEWTGTPMPRVPERLRFRTLREASERTFVEAIERVMEGTLDEGDQADRDALGPELAARQHFAGSQSLVHDPEWWNLGYTPGGDLVGIVLASENDGGPIIDYLGVVPQHRGQGYAHELLAKGTLTLVRAGAKRIRADTDVHNQPMANAFRRAGYQQFAIRSEFCIDLSKQTTNVLES